MSGLTAKNRRQPLPNGKDPGGHSQGKERRVKGKSQSQNQQEEPEKEKQEEAFE